MDKMDEFMNMVNTTETRELACKSFVAEHPRFPTTVTARATMTVDLSTDEVVNITFSVSYNGVYFPGVIPTYNKAVQLAENTARALSEDPSSDPWFLAAPVAATTRKETEEEILNLLLRVHEAHKRYNPFAHYLSAAIVDGAVMFWNDHENDQEHPIDVYFELLDLATLGDGDENHAD